MKKRFTMFLVILGVLSLAFSAHALTIYTSYGDFLADFPNPTVENFEDAILQPGLTVVSANGIIADGVFKDLVDDPSDTTTWTNYTGFYSWGGWFDLAGPGGPGSNLLITAVGQGAIGEIPNTYTGQFWGFATGTPFTSVLISEGTNPAGVQETYWSVDLAYKAVPEPATMMLLGLGLLGLGLVKRKK